MKPNEVHRGISSRHARSGGDAPLIGRVTRLREKAATATGGVRRSRRRGDAARKRLILVWSLVLGGAAIILMGLAFTSWLLPLLHRKPTDNSAAKAARDASVRVTSKFPSPSREQALDIVKQALSNRDPAMLDSLFRPASLSKSEILAYLSASDRRDGPATNYEWLSSLDSDGLLIEGVLVIYQGDDKRGERLALLTPDTEGNWKMDFDAFARTCHPPLNKLIEDDLNHAVVRVITAPDVYYNGPFLNEKLWVCYGMASPDTEQLLRGYCKTGTPEAEAMAGMFSRGNKNNRATLEVSRVKGGETRQFEITRVLASDWVLPADDQ